MNNRFVVIISIQTYGKKPQRISLRFLLVFDIQIIVANAFNT
jgi:hypothetical protein